MFEARRSLWWPRPVDLATLNENARVLLGEHDFRAFTPAETEHRSFVRTVHAVQWVELGEAVLAFEITANSFLRHMVRTLVGSMLEGRNLADAARGKPAQRRRRHRAAPRPVPHARVLSGHDRGLTPRHVL